MLGFIAAPESADALTNALHNDSVPAVRSRAAWSLVEDRKSTRLNSSHTEIYTLSLHDALPIYAWIHRCARVRRRAHQRAAQRFRSGGPQPCGLVAG